jgi:hypothetical protein
VYRRVSVSIPIALLVLALFSGCVGSQAKSAGATASSTIAAPATFDSGTGGLDGLVHDDNLLPLADAQVGLLGTDIAPATTDAAGKFSFSHLAPGNYKVAAQRLGYEATAKAVDVPSGAVATVDLTLVAVAVKEAFSEVLHGRGLFGCGMSWRPAVLVSGIAVCGVVAGTQFDDFLLRFKLTGSTKDWKGAVYEMRWKSSQAFGKGLSVNFEVDGCSNTAKSTFQRIRGSSPLRAWQNTSVVEDRLANNTDSGCSSKTNCTPKACTIQSRVFSNPDTLGASSPADVGITIQQTFEQFISVFYNGEAPLTYTVVTDE